jgi:magnesium chelatase family protein
MHETSQLGRYSKGCYMYAHVYSAALLGAQGHPLVVEAHIGKGIPGFTIVGLPDESCRESRDRVRAALLSSELPWPNKRVTINLVGSDERKGGAALDLAIAVALLVAQEIVPQSMVDDCAFLGELGLDGSLRHTTGIAPLVMSVASREVVVAHADAEEAALVQPRVLRAASTLREVAECLREEKPWSDVPVNALQFPARVIADMSDVRGQGFARRALEVAAAGHHHVLMVGSPGSGKSMLAKRLPGLLPPLSQHEALQAAIVRSAAGVRRDDLVSDVPPFRAPHHSVSMVAMVGGGSAHMRPGEISLASGGVLFLDEMGEFAPSVLDALRQPLEEGVIRLSRARGSLEMPARFMLIGASNPCPCGEVNPQLCTCAPHMIQRYVRRFSGPLLDRFDIRIMMNRPTAADLTSDEPSESSSVIAERVAYARKVAMERQGCLNADITAEVLDDVAPLSLGAKDYLHNALSRATLSGRGYHRVRRVARTIADLRGAPSMVSVEHVETALSMRHDVMAKTAMV